MHAMKAIYRDGTMDGLSLLSAIDDADPLIIQRDCDGRIGISVRALLLCGAEDALRALGVASIADDDDDDQQIDRKEVFDVHH